MAETFIDDTLEPEGLGNVVPLEIEEPPELIELKQRLTRLQWYSDQINVAEELDDEQVSKLGPLVVREYNIDETSRSEWKKRAQRAMDIAKQSGDDKKNHPWPNASNVKYPTITVAALQFAARAYPAICDGPLIVKSRVLGKDAEGLKAAAGERVAQHMSYQLMTELPEWEEDMDTCLHQIPIVGCAFKKVYRSPDTEAGFGDDLISAFDFVVNKNTKTLKRTPRATHKFELYPHEIDERRADGRFLDVDLDGTDDDGEDSDAPHMFLEQHRYYDLDGDGVKEPWIVTVHEKTETVVRIRAGYNAQAIVVDYQRFRINRIPKQEYFVKIPFIPDPEGGFYDVGFGHLLDRLSDAIDTTINQMMDAGTIQNSGGGFIGAGVDLAKGKAEIRMEPGKYKTVKSSGDDIRRAIVNFEHPGPSKVLFELLGLLLEASKDITAVSDVLTGEVNRNQPATTTMALIEQGLKVFSAIYKRIFRALKQEFRLIFEINKVSLDQDKYVALLDEPVTVTQEDYHGDLDIQPVSDANSVTDMQRLAKAQVVLDEAKNGNPHVDLKEATKRAFEAARIDRMDEILVEEKPNPMADLEMDAAKEELKKKMAEAEKALLEVKKMHVEISKLAMEEQKLRAELGVDPEAPAPVPEPIVEAELNQEPMEQQMPMDPTAMPPEGVELGMPEQDMAAQLGGMPGEVPPA